MRLTKEKQPMKKQLTISKSSALPRLFTTTLNTKKTTSMKTNSTSRSAFFHPRVLIGFIVLLLIPQAGSAQTQNPATADYDAVRDFSIISNPNGVWSYGWLSSLGSPLNLYTVTDTTSVTGMSAWLESGTIPPSPCCT